MCLTVFVSFGSELPSMRSFWPRALMRTVHAPRETGRVVSSVRAARSRRFGGNSATPCETMVRAKSTGSPPPPMSGSSVTVCMSAVLESEPRSELLDLGFHRLRDRPSEFHVLVDRVHSQHRNLAVCERVEFPDEAVTVQDRQREVAPAPLRSRLVHLERVLELEELLRAAPVVDQPVEGRQQRCPTLELLSEGGRVDSPLASRALDDRGLARVADEDRLDRHHRRFRTRDAE